MSELKRCPFCGGEAELFETHEKQYYIIHQNDDCVIDSQTNVGNWLFDTKEEAIAAWNTRKPIERILERLKKESFVIEIDYDYDEYDDEPVEAVFLNEAIEIVKEEGEANVDISDNASD